jgi:hypothetical protein
MNIHALSSLDFPPLAVLKQGPAAELKITLRRSPVLDIG